MTVAAIPDQRALRDPTGACIADGRHELDNAGFAERVTALAAVFDAAGLRPGGVLAIMLPNRVELITSMFAAWRLGAAVTPVKPALTAQEARYQIDDAGATLVVADEVAAAMLRDGPYRIIGLKEVTAPVPASVPPALVTDPDALALLIYTSGTTGRPKGVMLDHANVSATADIIVGWFEMTGDTRSLLVLPLFHVNGIMVSVVSPLLAGGSTFIAERFHAASFWATVEQVRPTFFSAVPTIYALLVSRPGAPPDTRSLRFVICGAAPMPRQLIGEFEQRFSVPVVEGYGLSECTVVCTLNPLHGTRKAGRVWGPGIARTNGTTAGVTLGGKWQGTFGTIWQDPAWANEAANSLDQYAPAAPERRSPDDYEHEETPWHYVTVSPPALLGARDFFNETGTPKRGKPRSWAWTAWRDLRELWGYLLSASRRSRGRPRSGW